MNEDLKHILAAAIQAPSGENSQPWHFIIQPSEVIEIHLLPERDQSFYSWGSRASYLANGAALENMIIAASTFGYRADIFYFPNQNDILHIATVKLIKDLAVVPDPLAESIFRRVSNRNPYLTEPLSKEIHAAFTDCVKDTNTSFVLIEDTESIKVLAEVGAVNEEVILSNKSLHNFFFSHINWTKEEDTKKKVGFYIETLELPPPAKIMFKLFQYWPVMSIFNLLGFNKIVSKQNAATYGASSAIGAVISQGMEPLDFVKAGRTVERLWLTATQHNLAVQPLTGVLYFNFKITGGEENDFSKTQLKTITDAYKKVTELTRNDKRPVVFMFRVGHSKPPSAQAARFTLEESCTVQF